MVDIYEFPATYEALKDDFPTIWTTTLLHPWSIELETLEEFFWTELTFSGDTILWTLPLKQIYLRMKVILMLIKISFY